MKTLVPALLLLASCMETLALIPALAPPVAAMQSPDATTAIRPGIEVFLSDLPPALRGKRVGLVTNQTGIDRARTSDIDLIAQHKDLKLVALLALSGSRGNLRPPGPTPPGGRGADPLRRRASPCPSCSIPGPLLTANDTRTVVFRGNYSFHE